MELLGDFVTNTQLRLSYALWGDYRHLNELCGKRLQTIYMIRISAFGAARGFLAAAFLSQDGVLTNMSKHSVTGEGFEILASGPRRSVFAGGFESFEHAKIWARNNMRIAFMEDDADHVGCADILTNWGEVYCIQPVGFKL